MVVKSNFGCCICLWKIVINGGMLDDLENKLVICMFCLKKFVFLVLEKMDNCKVVIEKLKLDFVNIVRYVKIGWKWRRVESEDEVVIGEEE